jgi:SAM-dependent MidA family methyltransferase
MLTSDQALTDLIRQRIRRDGPVSFAWFMEQALYHPELGYYSSGRCAIGRKGDYFTNVSVGPLFGRLLAAQFAEMWKWLGWPEDVVIVEQGAHQGDFARDVLGAVRERAPDLFAALRYWIVEPFPILRERQMEALRDFSGKVVWKESLVELEPFSGVHFSNELLDAMPVRLISRLSEERASARPGHAEANPGAAHPPSVTTATFGAPSRAAATGWEERRVTESGDGFDFVTAPITCAELRRHLQRIPREVPEGYETEVNLRALDWMDQLAPKLTRGYVLAVDYGHSRENYYAPERSSGTLQGYSNHRVLSSPLTEIGHADITAHVDWTSLAERAEANGLTVAGFTDQHHFATGIVTALMAEQFGGNADASTRRALQTLLHPEFLGTTFQFLALTKDIAPGVPLSGFKFARDPRVALGL